MACYRIRETFFRPETEHAQETGTLPADLHNGLQLLLARDGAEHCFLPIRSMQYLAVIARDEVVFVDANGGYAHQDGVGGRLIRIAWRPVGGPRESISAPLPYAIIYYFSGLAETQRRLLGETRAVLRLQAARQRERAAPVRVSCIVPMRRR